MSHPTHIDHRIIEFFKIPVIHDLISNPHTLRLINKTDQDQKQGDLKSGLASNIITPKGFNNRKRVVSKLSQNGFGFFGNNNEASDAKINPSEYSREHSELRNVSNKDISNNRRAEKRKSRSRIGSILLPPMNIEKPLADEQMVQ